ncbi:hypothetical protein NFI96_014870, partial [Prochilodus magdalenae]
AHRGATMTTFDDILEEAGKFGRFQKRIFALLCLTSVPFAGVYVGIVFQGFTPEHWCRDPGLEQLRENCDWDLKEARRFIIPLVNSSAGVLPSQCQRYDVDWNITELTCDTLGSDLSKAQHAALPIVSCKNGWDYDYEGRESFVTEFDLVCSDAWLVDIFQAILGVGFLVGSISIGYLADKFGRRVSFLVSNLLNAVTGILVAISPNYISLVVFRALHGFGVKGGWMAGYMLCMSNKQVQNLKHLFPDGTKERRFFSTNRDNAYVLTELVGVEYRRVVGVLFQMVFSCGLIVLALIAYLIPDWRWLQVAITVPYIIFLSYYWFIPESPRWLLSQNKSDQAVKITEAMAKENKKTLSKNIESPVTTDVGLEYDQHCTVQQQMSYRLCLHIYKVDQQGAIDYRVNMTCSVVVLWGSRPLKNRTLKDDNADSVTGSFMDLIRTPNIRKYTLILSFNWFTSAVVYQGLIMRLGILGGNIYIDFLISGIVEFPAALLILFTIERIGRRLPFATANIVSGVACLVTAFIPESLFWLKTVMACIGRLGITMAFEMVVFVNTELYPTFIRNLGVSVCSTLCDIGGIIAPFLLYRLAVIWLELPLIIFGVLAFIAGGLVLLLPETKGVPLPETIDDIEYPNR